jgi:hypothetical protein
MKEVRLKFEDLSQTRKESIMILRDWLFDLYINNNQSNYKIWNWLSEIIINKITLTHSDFQNLRELWDIYVEYKKGCDTLN